MRPSHAPELIPVFVVAASPAILAVVRIEGEGAAEIGAIRPVHAFRDLEDHASGGSAPIVVIDVDEALPEPLDPLHEVRAIRPDARVVMLSSDARGERVLGALQAGARAFVHKPEGLRTLRDVLTRVARDEVVLPPDLQRDALEELGRAVRRAREGSGVEALLSRRERQILDLLAEGLTTRQIATCLSISPRTVEGHTSGIYRKLVVRTRVQAVARAAAMGLVGAR